MKPSEVECISAFVAICLYILGVFIYCNNSLLYIHTSKISDLFLQQKIYTCRWFNEPRQNDPHKPPEIQK